MSGERRLRPYRTSLAGTLLEAREAVMARIRPRLRAANVTEQQWRVLRVLVDEGAIDPSRLAQSALLHAPSVTRILRELLDRQLIERSVDPQDARRSIITISAAGRATITATAAHTLALLDDYATAFGRERLERLVEELQALTAAIAVPGASEPAEHLNAEGPAEE